MIAGLWPVYRGLVSRPRNNGTDGIMFLPQRPYLSIGTLRDQVIYPDGEVEMRAKGRTDEELTRILQEAHLGHLLGREGGFDTRKEWKNVLSGGEKQRMAIARILYHEPRYAVIDEGTSAISSEVEPLLYETAKERGISKWFIHPTPDGLLMMMILIITSFNYYFHTSFLEEVSYLQSHTWPRRRVLRLELRTNRNGKGKDECRTRIARTP